jgi:cardiolipin synthase
MALAPFISKELVEELTESGVHFRFFSFSANSLHWPKAHHKVVVADAHVLMIGGINMPINTMVSPEKNPGWITQFR